MLPDPAMMVRALQYSAGLTPQARAARSYIDRFRTGGARVVRSPGRSRPDPDEDRDRLVEDDYVHPELFREIANGARQEQVEERPLG